MAKGRLLGQRGRRTSSAAMSQRVVGKGRVFMETPDGKLLEIVNPNNPADVDAVQVRQLSGDEQDRQRRRFLRGRAGAVAGRGKTKPRSRVLASQIDVLRQRERTLRQDEEERRGPRPTTGRRIK